MDRSRPLLHRSITVEPAHIYSTCFNTGRDRNPRIAGRFVARGGFGNDIQVVIGAEDAITNWRNGHVAALLCDSGHVTVGDIDVSLPSSGRYCVVLGNQFALLSSKTIDAAIDYHFLGFGAAD
jgi:hypothetical protein